MSALPDSILVPDGDGFAPTALARGPWYADSQHGSPMLGLLARAVERLPSAQPMQVVRLTVDLMRAAPMRPVRTEARVVRAGKSVEVIEARLCAGDEECARASAMRFRLADIPTSPDASFAGATAGHVPPPPSSVAAAQFGWDEAGRSDGPRLHHALEMRPVPGFESPTAWLRMRVPLVAGEEPSPLVRIAVVSDFTYTLPLMRLMRRDLRAMARQPFVSINPDTALNLHRMPEGEWLCLDSSALYGDVGAGTALARLYDVRGPFGHSSQSVLVRGVEARPESWKEWKP